MSGQTQKIDSRLMLSFKLGPLAISVGTLLIITAFLVSLAVGHLLARRKDIAIGDTLFAITLAGLVTARVAFVLKYFSSYGLDLLAWIDIRDGGFSFIAGVAGAAIYAGLFALRQNAMRRPLSFALLAGALTWGIGGGAISLMQNQASRPPGTELYTLDGAVTDLQTLQLANGKLPMVVNLWATWCPPCRAEMPVLEKAQNEKSGILFVLVNQQEAAPTIRAFIEQTQLKFNHVLQDTHGDIARQAGSVALPTTLFYNAEGRLVDSHVGPLSNATLARALERIEH